MAAKILNVDPQKKDDMFYRYKMPELLIKHESRGNGAKTVFPNIREVCVKLQRPPELLNKYFGNELGAQASFLKGDDKFLVMGHRTQEDMQVLVYKFIERTILCKQCRNPETEPRVEKKNRNERLVMTCRSCGKDTEVSSTEKIHKFMCETYVALAKHKKKDVIPKPEGAGASAAEAGEADPSSADAETVAKAVPAPAAGTKAKIETNTEKLATVNPVTALSDVVRQVPAPSVEKVIQSIMDIKAECNVGDAHTVRFVWRGIVDGVDGSKLIGVAQQWVLVLSHFTHKDKMYSTLIAELARSCGECNVTYKFPMGLKMLWEEGVVPESEIKEWVDTYKGKTVSKDVAAASKAKAKPLLQWLEGTEITA
jgi:translation initiation factor 5